MAGAVQKATKTATGPKGQSAVKKTVGAAGKAVGAEAAGGGPEDPVADIVAVKEAAGSLKGDKKSKDSSTGKTTAKKTSGKQAPKSRKVRALSWAWSGNRKLITAEFVIVLLILALGTLTTPGSVKDELTKALVKGSALSLLFVIAGLVASTGTKAAKPVTAITTLVTIAYVFTSPEARGFVAWIGAFFAPPKNAGK